MNLATSPKPELDFNDIFSRHGINPEHHHGIRDLTRGVPPTPELRIRLERVTNYQECLDEILTRLSQPFSHLFRSPA